MNVLDSFAGAGGFSLGFSMVPEFNIVGGIELDSWAAETFAANHPEARTLVGPIESFSDRKLLQTFRERPDIILGGPPCQGFSVANRNAGDPRDPRNSLFREFIRLGRVFQPGVMIMENVPGLVKAKTHDGELVIDIIRAELEGLGYHVNHTILNATDYGVPQIRKRLFVVATAEPIENPFPAPTHYIDGQPTTVGGRRLRRCPTLWDAISDLPDIEAREGAPVMEYTKRPTNDFQRAMRAGSTRVYNHTAMKHGARMVERFASMAWGDSTTDVPAHLRPQRRNGGGELSDKAYDQNNRRMAANKPCHTIAASFYANFVHPYKHRNFTPREGARIQTFPDNFIFKGLPTVVSHKLLQREGRHDEKHLCQYNQIGNAVPPFLARAVAANIVEQLIQEEAHVRAWR
jgi:DNA (cytosine-5)-methyltransferase 1